MNPLLWLLTWAGLLVLNIQAYSKVSHYGQPRSGAQDVAFTLSPVYVASQRTTTLDLRPGEAVNHPSTPKYSTINENPSSSSQLDISTARKNAQDRFRPPAGFEHAVKHVDSMRPQSIDLRPDMSSKDVMFSKPAVSMAYYPPSNFGSNLMPITVKTPPAVPLPSYAQPKPSNNDPQPQIIYDNKPPTFEFDNPPKSIDFPDNYSPYDDGSPPYGHPPYHEDEIVYDHIPDDHHHGYHHYHHPRPTTTTMEPEMMDQRLNKRPYSYYYIGKKLWYVPLYFSIYFIIYIAALVLKSIARHKINFPAHLAAVANGARSDDGDNTPGWTDYVVKVLEAIEKYAVKS